MGREATMKLGYSLHNSSFSDTTNLTLSLSGRRDRVFYSYRQLCLYPCKLYTGFSTPIGSYVCIPASCIQSWPASRLA